jgi:hypothetical protein
MIKGRIYLEEIVRKRIHSDEMHILRGDDPYENVFWEDD